MSKEKEYDLYELKEAYLLSDLSMLYNLINSDGQKLSSEKIKEKADKGEFFYPVGTRFVAVTGKRKDGTFKCFALQPEDITGIPKKIRFAYECSLRPSELKFVKRVSENELGNAGNEELRAIAVTQKLKRFLKEGAVQAKIAFSGRLGRMGFPEGTLVYIKQGIQFSYRGISIISGGNVFHTHPKYLDYDSISLAPCEDMLTADNGDLRLQAAGEEKYFPGKVKQGIERRFKISKKGLFKIKRLVSDLVQAKQIIPQEIASVNKKARKQIAERLKKLAKETELQSSFDKFVEQLEKYQEEAVNVIQVMFQTPQENDPT